jgi:transcriptional regulator with XRE-family HTH domain
MAQAQRRGRPRNDPGQPWSGRSLRLRRLDAGLTMRELGDMVGATASTVLLWEAERRLPSQETVVLLAKVLRCRPRDLGRAPRL